MFINLRQGGMSFHENILKFTILSKYSPSLVSNPRDEMSHFVMRVSDGLQQKCHLTMLDHNMNISHLMVDDKHVEEARAYRKSRDAKMAKYFDSGSSKNRL